MEGSLWRAIALLFRPAGLCAPGATAPNCPRSTPSFPDPDSSCRKCQLYLGTPGSSNRVLILCATSPGTPVAVAHPG